jgi:hypothetical protein
MAPYSRIHCRCAIAFMAANPTIRIANDSSHVLSTDALTGGKVIQRMAAHISAST